MTTRESSPPRCRWGTLSSRSNLYWVVFTLVVLFVAAAAAWAQELEISVSPSPVGSGARAAGMADAFVAIADDATAASWNPAGLIQLERPEIAIVGAYNSFYEEFGAPYHDEIEGWNHEDDLSLNFLSATYPLPVLIAGRNAVVGLYYQHKYDFSRDFRFEYNTSSVSLQGTVLNRFLDMDFQQSGSLSTITPAFAMEVTHRLSLGIAVNLWRSSFLAENGWEQHLRTETFAVAGGIYSLAGTDTREEYRDVRGENVTLGLLWSINDRWSLGARYDSAWTAKADYRRERSRWQLDFPWVGGSSFSLIPEVVQEPRDIRFPSTIALGAACRVNDKLTLSCDVSRTDWNDFWYRGRSGNRISLVSAANLDALLFAPEFEPTYTVRFGTEYVFVPKHPEETFNRIWTLRGGMFYDQEPATNEPDNFWGAALGLGLLANQRVNVDLAYQCRYGHDVNSDFVRGIRGFNEDVFQHRFLVSTVIYF